MKEEKEEKVRNKKETEGQKSWTIEVEESDDLSQFSHDTLASMRKDRKRSHKKNRVAGKCGSGKKPVLY
jgi:hypothetical protein